MRRVIARAVCFISPRRMGCWEVGAGTGARGRGDTRAVSKAGGTGGAGVGAPGGERLSVPMLPLPHHVPTGARMLRLAWVGSCASARQLASLWAYVCSRSLL